MSACPKCGEPRGGRYKHNGRLVCWRCTGLKPLPAYSSPRDPEWVRFRRRILGRLDQIDRRRFFYIDASECAHVCPVCRCADGFLSIRFIGQAPRAEVKCSNGCPPEKIARALDLEEVAWH